MNHIHSNTRHTRRHRSLIAAAAALASLCVVGACEGETSHPPANDLNSGWTCDTTDGSVRAAGTITNHSSQASFYNIEVEFRSDNGGVTERSTSIDDVEPGETVTVGVVADQFGGGSEVTCRVSDVTRLKA
jgi:hypothetical protein